MSFNASVSVLPVPAACSHRLKPNVLWDGPVVSSFWVLNNFRGDPLLALGSPYGSNQNGELTWQKCSQVVHLESKYCFLI